MSRTSARTSMRALVALDIDGTLVDAQGQASAATRSALGLARASGHEPVLATGRSLAGLLPIARLLDLTDGWSVASNGAILVRLDSRAPGGYRAEDVHRFDPRQLIRRAQELLRGVVVAVEDVGVGWRVSRRLPDRALNGVQRVASLADLGAAPANRVVLVAPGIRRFTDALAATGVTVTPAGPDWLDVVGPGVSKAATLEVVRQRLEVAAEDTVAVGDGVNDMPMLRWAATSYAMGNAPAIVRHSARSTCGTLEQDGAADVLRALVPAAALEPALSPLAAQLVAAVDTAPSDVTLRVWHGTGTALTSVTAWLLDDGPWRIHATIPAGIGASMRDVENAARESGLGYPHSDLGLNARWRRTTLTDRPTSFELPVWRP